MKLSLMAAVAENGIIGCGLDIPWQVKGEQLLFKAMTFNQWLIVGRKTFASMGKLPNRKYAVISRSQHQSNDPDVMYFTSTEKALEHLQTITDHVFVSGGGEIYKMLLPQVETIHLSTIHKNVAGDIYFPELPAGFSLVFEQKFSSNIDYTYQIFQRDSSDS
ncbi:trimethoprim-resistant dihydrofolate reductase DfrA [Catenovulum sp. SX2]|uniref:trimethoprim-resistant dihydrofolate reductase DfrA n=1 Tax=Catenovulum sp. SX2 TaxID=3398614 RepID=UPI003F82460F